MHERPHAILPPHGGYKKLASYQNAEIVYDATVAFCKKYKSNMTYKTYEQIVGAARSGKQNIAEGSVISGTSKKSELKLMGVARGSLAELLEDYHDFLREYKLEVWHKDSGESLTIRKLAYCKNRSYTTYMTYIERSSKVAANTLICLINQTTFLLDRQIKSLEEAFLKHGGFTERLYKARKNNI